MYRRERKKNDFGDVCGGEGGGRGADLVARREAAAAAVEKSKQHLSNLQDPSLLLPVSPADERTEQQCCTGGREDRRAGEESGVRKETLCGGRE